MEENKRTQTDEMVIQDQTGVRQYKTEISHVKTIKVEEAIKIQETGGQQRGQDRWDMNREEWQKGEANQLQDIEEESMASQENLENYQENTKYWADELENWQRNLGEREDPLRIAVIVDLFGIIISVGMVIVLVLHIRAPSV